MDIFHGSERTRQGVARGFTLVELLVVIAIISMLLAVTVPVTSNVLKSNKITTATQMLVDQLSQARLTALVQNRVVEVRFYKFTSPERMSTNAEIAAMETMIYDAANTKSQPLNEVHYLPDGAVINSAATLSTLVQDSRLKSDWSSQDPQKFMAHGIGTNYSAYRLRFLPDGSTDLGVGTWFITVNASQETAAAPVNYATIQVDSHNGSLRLYRPG